MTGLEVMKSELLKRGYNKAQTESKVVIGVLEIVSENKGFYTNEENILSDINASKSIRHSLEQECIELSKKLNVLRTEYEEIMSAIKSEAHKRYFGIKEYIDQFLKALEECETKEGKDALKLAQMFVNTVNVDTTYDNYAFIKGLAEILSRGGGCTLDKLNKVTDDVPELDFEAELGTIYGYKQKEWNVKEKRKKIVL